MRFVCRIRSSSSASRSREMRRRSSASGLGHRADPAFAPRPSHQRAQQSVDVNCIGLAPPLAPIDRNRGGIHDMALETVGLQQAVQPEAVKPGFLDNCHRHRSAKTPFRRLAQPLEQGQQAGSIARSNGTFGNLDLARRAGRNEPGLAAELQRYEQRAILRSDGSRNRMGKIGADHCLPP